LLLSSTLATGGNGCTWPLVLGAVGLSARSRRGCATPRLKRHLSLVLQRLLSGSTPPAADGVEPGVDVPEP
jgi:hypothetical protein